MAAADSLKRFTNTKLSRYAELHNAAESDATSRLSPYLHFGHLSAHQVFDSVMGHERWSKRLIVGKPANGAREGWWDVSASAEAFLDQSGGVARTRLQHVRDTAAGLRQVRVTARVGAAYVGRALKDRRPHLYDLETLERGATHDPLWNAAQGQMRREGWFHNYMRMLWGKKILEWSPTPQLALERMIAIMNRWSLDGRNPNSYSGYFWTLGRYDRPWPERPIFGVVRSMSSTNTAKKIPVKQYIATYAPAVNPQTGLPL